MFSAGPRSFLDLSKHKAAACKAAVQHYFLNKVLNAAYALTWPEMDAVDRIYQTSSDPGVHSASEPLRAAIFRTWFIAACKIEQLQHQHQHQKQCTAPHAPPEHMTWRLQQQTWDVAASVLPPHAQSSNLASCLLALATATIKLRLLVSSQQQACPGMRIIFKPEAGQFDPGRWLLLQAHVNRCCLKMQSTCHVCFKLRLPFTPYRTPCIYVAS